MTSNLTQKVSAVSLALTFAHTTFAGALHSPHGLSGIDGYPAPAEVNNLSVRIQSQHHQLLMVQKTCVRKLENFFGKKWDQIESNTENFLQPFQGLVTEIVPTSDPSIGVNDMATTGGNGDSVFIKFSLEKFLTGQTQVETTVCHELVHAYFRKWMKPDAYSALPKWVREGSAVYLSGQIKEKERTFLFRDSLSLGDLPKFFNGLEGPHTFLDYLEDAKAFEFLESLGEGTVVRVLTEVLTGKPIFEAIENTTRLKKEEFLEKATRFGREAMESIIDGLPQEIRHARYSYEKKGEGYIQAKSTLIRYLESRGIKYGTAPVTQDALKSTEGLKTDTHLLYALKLISIINSRQSLSTKITEADDTLAIVDFLLDDVPASMFGQDTLPLRSAKARIVLRQKNWPAVFEIFQQIYGEHVEDEYTRMYATKMIGQSLMEQGRFSEALPWLDVEKGTSRDSEIKFMVIVCQFLVKGDSVKAREELHKLFSEEKSEKRIAHFKQELLRFAPGLEF